MTKKSHLKKISRDKVHVHILLSKKIYNELMKLAPLIYGAGKYRGAISYVVERALEVYLSTHKNTQTPPNPRGNIRQVYDAVVRKIMEIQHYDFKPAEIPEKILDLAISEVRGSDERTIRKWKNLFRKYGLIKFLGGTYPNRIVELL